MRLVTRVALATTALMVIAAGSLPAQALGPQRQLLSLEPFYTNLRLDAGPGASRIGLSGYGGLLWLNLAPFSGPSRNLIGRTGLALFVSYTPDQGGRGFTTLHYGGELDYHFVDYPIGGRLDPLISLGAGAFRTHVNGSAGSDGASRTKFALTPGVGLRIPLTNRFQLRGDARDVIIFSNSFGSSGEKRTANNIELRAGLGLTF